MQNEENENESISTEMRNFKNACSNTNQYSIAINQQKNAFKVPQPPDEFNVPLSIKPVFESSTHMSNFSQKRSKVLNELKVFNNSNTNNSNMSNNNLTKHSLFFNTMFDTNDQSMLRINNELPKNSTPIYTDNTNSAYMLAKRKQLLNAKLDLTITGPISNFSAPVGNNIMNSYANLMQKQQQLMMQEKQQQQPLIPENLEEETIEEGYYNLGNGNIINHPKQEFILPKISINIENGNDEQAVKTSSTLRTAEQTDADGSGGGVALKGQTKQINKINTNLNVSKIHCAFEAVSTSANLISIPKSEIPKEFKKKIKNDIKKDKSMCSIQ
jgi:hypothetical protein